ncbi:MAG TPA: ribosome maturation factor RimM [Fibrobacteraceae bacterium]|nr:ribosome maturation factor RimM [Fibrobacteraceae bacterium]
MNDSQDWVSVARLLRPHGTRGEMKTEPLTHSPSRLGSLCKVRLWMPNGRTCEAEIVSASVHGAFWNLLLKGYDSPEASKALIGALVQIPMEDRLPPPAGAFYPSDLEGLIVLNEYGEKCGVVLELLELPSVPVFSLRLQDKEVFAPWIPDCVGEINLERRTMTVRFSYLTGVYPELS